MHTIPSQGDPPNLHTIPSWGSKNSHYIFKRDPLNLHTIPSRRDPPNLHTILSWGSTQPSHYTFTRNPSNLHTIPSGGSTQPSYYIFTGDPLSLHTIPSRGIQLTFTLYMQERSTQPSHGLRRYRRRTQYLVTMKLNIVLTSEREGCVCLCV